MQIYGTRPMCAATSADEPRVMNDIAYYRAEINYRREQMRRDQEPFRVWRRTMGALSRRSGAR